MVSRQPSFFAKDKGKTQTDSKLAVGGSLLGAFALTSCCILPLVLISLGVGGVWIAQLTSLYAYKWYTFSFAASFIAYGFWKTYRVETTECPNGTSCAHPVSRRIMKGSLWLATVVTTIAMIFPYIAPYFLKF